LRTDLQKTAVNDLALMRRELLELRIRAATAEPHVDAEIPKRQRNGDLVALSFAQQRLWFLDRYESSSAVYNIPMALRLKGELEAGALGQALNELVRRHEALRTLFVEQEGTPYQRIVPALELELGLRDLHALASKERDDQARRLVREEAARPFDLAKGPLIRAKLIRLGEQEHLLCLTLHHIVGDGWSIGVLEKELKALYAAFCQGKPSPLPELPIQYADYAYWQRQWLQGEVLQGQLDYWKGQLAGAPALLELPTDRPRPALQSHRGAVVRFGLSTDLSAKLNALAQKRGVTLFMVLAAAFKVLLSRYSGQEDICIGTPVANRNRAELEGLIGFFVNTLVLRSRVSAEESFEELLRRVQRTALEAYSHQDLPFERLVEELKPQRSLSHAPLFQVMLILQNAPRERGESKGLRFKPMASNAGISKFDLTCTMTESQGRLLGTLEYHSDLFDGSTIERLAKHYEVLLEGICAHPEQKVGRLGLLTEQEKRQLLKEWNATEASYPKDKCVHQLFEEQVRRAPEAVAVVFEGEELSYGELNRRANRLARYLRAQGVGPEDLVGVCVERSLEMVVGLLGILKAGGAYVPLDPSYPQERLTYMLQDAAPKVLLTQERLLGVLASQQATMPLCLDRDWATIAKHPDSDPPSHTKPQNLAYVIYTSGSTGKPKGVEGTHQALVNRVRWMASTYAATPGERCAQKTALGFIDSITETIGPLLGGSTLWVLGHRAASDPETLWAQIKGASISRLVVVPSLLEALLQADPAQFEAHPLKLLVSSGEALSTELLAKARERLGSTRILNLYGSSEVTGDGSFYDAAGATSPGLRGVPIGRPIANTRLYILDGRYNPVPVGVAGELYIGGDGVGRGYLKRPELTAERFVADPFNEAPGARLYKTGDLARYLSDGNIEYLGRIDHQVKIRGFRIELGEVEAALLESAGVAQALVLAREDEPGDKRLVAYVVAASGEQLEPEALRARLKQKLPEYMVPAVFMVLEALPLSPNGKVDRKALPAPDGSRQSAREYVVPRTELEAKLAAIWAQVLKVEKVGVHDNFFELGGHSLQIIRVANAIELAFGRRISVQTLYIAADLGAVAEILETKSEDRSAVEQPALEIDPHRIELSPAQELHLFLEKTSAPFDFSSNTLTFTYKPGHLNVELLESAFHALERTYPILTTQYRQDEEGPYAVLAPASFTERFSVHHADGKTSVSDLFRKKLDIWSAGVYRVDVLLRPDQGADLLIKLHNSVFDRRSIELLVRGLAAAYLALRRGTVPQLQREKLTYYDWSLREQGRRSAASEVVKAVAYWQNKKRPIGTMLNFGDNIERPAEFSFRGDTLWRAFSSAAERRVTEASLRQRVSLFIVLCAGLVDVLGESARDDVVISTMYTERQFPGADEIIGPFAKPIFLRFPSERGRRLSELIKVTRAEFLESISHANLLGSQIAAGFPRLGRAYPHFQVSFQHHEAEILTSQRTYAEIGLAPSGKRPSVARADLRIATVRRRGRLTATLGYYRDGYKPELIDRLFTRWNEFFEQAAESPRERSPASAAGTSGDANELQTL
jgi:amino acid adenylation domain-containing protein